jgi:hypothetical protein
MAIPVKMKVTIRDAAGTSSARLSQLSDSMLELEGETQHKPGTSLEFQLDLAGFGSTIRGRAEVEKVFESEFGRGRCLLRITQMAPHQRATFRAWLYELSLGGSRILDELANDDAEPELPGVPERPRPSVRESFTSFSSQRPHQQARGATASQPAPTRRKRRRVEIRVAAGASPPMVVIRYNDPSRYNSHYWEQLHRGTLQLRHRGVCLEPDAPVRVRLILPGGTVITCSGTVTQSREQGFGLQLEPGLGDRSLMELSAGPRPDRQR